MIKQWITRLTQPTTFNNWAAEIAIALPRILCGLLLTIDFGGSKFGMPWTDAEAGLSLFEVASWFPEDVAKFGFPFNLAPTFFAWMGAASEAIGGLLLVLGFQTRISAFFVSCTMLVAIFFQKWGGGTWGMLPAMGFLWMSVYVMVLGSGRIGLDYLLSKKLNFSRKALVPVFGALALAISMSSCASYATVTIPAQQEFVLGEVENSNFKVKLSNLSQEEVKIRALDKESDVQTQGFGLDGKGNATLYVNRSEKVILENPNDNAIKVRAKLNKSVEGMRYQPRKN
ncbi:MAG: DoxX family protein [Phaeodactylibacter sp.]|nr:DoxX family protein [Phaeodactylibacter sp.]